MARTIGVVAGDTLSGIARRYYGSAEYAARLARYNGIGDPDLLQVGEMLELPARAELDGTKALPPPVAGPAAPHGLEGIIAAFGDIAPYIRDDGHLKPEWEARHLTTAPIPFAIPLSWNRSTQITGIYCHRQLAPVVARLFEAIHRQGLGSQIRTFGGCFNYRPKRRSSKLSTHCWGIAIDLNPETNRQGSAGDMHPELVALFRGHGFTWGGDWTGRSRDPMHFQYCSGY